jgi:hypothetical protein
MRVKFARGGCNIKEIVEYWLAQCRFQWRVFIHIVTCCYIVTVFTGCSAGFLYRCIFPVVGYLFTGVVTQRWREGVFTGVVTQRWEALVTSPLAGGLFSVVYWWKEWGYVTSPRESTEFTRPHLLLRHPCHNINSTESSVTEITTAVFYTIQI